jgi:hypothetical protein
VVLGEVALSLAKNLVLSPFSAARRAKAGILARVLAAGTSLLVRPAGMGGPRG